MPVLEVSVLVRRLFSDVGFRCWHVAVNKPNEVGRGIVVKCVFGKCEGILFACGTVDDCALALDDVLAKRC